MKFESLRTPIKELKDLAKSRGGKLISKKYVNQHKKLEWECKFGHKWFATYQPIKNGGWCSVCSSGLGERLTRIAFETIFKKKFKKERPDWLKSRDGYNFELDGYNPKLKLAFNTKVTKILDI